MTVSFSRKHMVAILSVIILYIIIMGTRNGLPDVLKEKSGATTIPRPATNILGNNAVAATRKPTKLLLVGYKRGGTSFVTALLHSHPEVFMLYEPIWYIQDPDIYGHAVTDTKVPLRERTKEQWKTKAHIPDPLEYISDMLNCNITSHNVEFIMYDGGSRDILKVRKCAKQSKSYPEDCYTKLSAECLQKSVILAKTVRLSLTEAGRMMEKDRDLKVLYLARDPRGNRDSYEQTMIKSNEKGWDFDSDTPPFNGMPLLKKRCELMNADATALRDLKQNFKGQLFVMRYEDIADDPINMAKMLFRHLGLIVNDKVKAGVQKLTSNPKAQDRPFDTRRKNSSSTASKWRNTISFDTVKILQRECHSIFKILRYTPFDNERDLRNPYVSYRESLEGTHFATP